MVSADEILWSYDLMELPQGWTHEGFTFDSSGASTYIYDWHFGSTRSITNWLQSSEIIIPSGCDSLVINVSQHAIIQIYADGSGHGTVELKAKVNSSWHTVWIRELSCYGTSDTLNDSTVIHETVPGIQAGDIVQFRFEATGNAVWYSDVYVWWWLWDASLTAYGEISLEQCTWAEIKSAM